MHGGYSLRVCWQPSCRVYRGWPFLRFCNVEFVRDIWSPKLKVYSSFLKIWWDVCKSVSVSPGPVTWDQGLGRCLFFHWDPVVIARWYRQLSRRKPFTKAYNFVIFFPFSLYLVIFVKVLFPKISSFIFQILPCNIVSYLIVHLSLHLLNEAVIPRDILLIWHKTVSNLIREFWLVTRILIVNNFWL